MKWNSKWNTGQSDFSAQGHNLKFFFLPRGKDFIEALWWESPSKGQIQQRISSLKSERRANIKTAYPLWLCISNQFRSLQWFSYSIVWCFSLLIPTIKCFPHKNFDLVRNAILIPIPPRALMGTLHCYIDKFIESSYKYLL